MSTSGAKHKHTMDPLIGPIVYSLQPGTKDIKLTDQWAGTVAWLIDEALGRGVEDRWREGRKGGR